MRLIGTIESDLQGRKFSSFLTEKGIRNQCEVVMNKNWGSQGYGTPSCNIWIYEEDQIDEAKEWLEKFKKNPENAEFVTVTYVGTPEIEIPDVEPKTESYRDKIIDITPPSMKPRKSPSSRLTMYIFLFCTLVFILSALTEPKLTTIPSYLPPTPLLSPPINKAMLFDYPYTYTLIDRLVNLYGIDSLESPKSLPSEGRYLITQYLETPYWKGFYDMVLEHWNHPEKGWNTDTPLFEKIRKGEIWRIWSPIFLHSDIFHLLFNMIWLLVLGKQMEPRLRPFRYILFIVITAAISNAAQYLMGGPNFIGYSGVLCAMLAFIWVRQQKAPWEGYQMQRGTIILMAIFVFAMFGIQTISFLTELLFHKALSPGIANTAHIVGGLTGYFLGKLNFFSWNPSS